MEIHWEISGRSMILQEDAAIPNYRQYLNDLRTYNGFSVGSVDGRISIRHEQISIALEGLALLMLDLLISRIGPAFHNGHMVEIGCGDSPGLYRLRYIAHEGIVTICEIEDFLRLSDSIVASRGLPPNIPFPAYAFVREAIRSAQVFSDFTATIAADEEQSPADRRTAMSLHNSFVEAIGTARAEWVLAFSSDDASLDDVRKDVVEFVHSGKQNEAITLIQDSIDCSVTTAREEVERIAASLEREASGPPPLPPLEDEVCTLLADGQTILAIQRVIQRTDMRLNEAKEWVMALKRDSPESSPA